MPQQQQPLLACPICRDSIPCRRMLWSPCGHGVCTACMIPLFSQARGVTTSPCPTCRKELKRLQFFAIFPELATQAGPQDDKNQFHVHIGGETTMFGTETNAYGEAPSSRNCRKADLDCSVNMSRRKYFSQCFCTGIYLRFFLIAAISLFTIRVLYPFVLGLVEFASPSLVDRMQLGYKIATGQVTVAAVPFVDNILFLHV